MTETTTEPLKKRGSKFFKRLTVMLVVLVTLAVVAGKVFFLPLFLQKQLESALRDYWDGETLIRDVELNLSSGPVVLNQVTLLDHTKQRWIYIDKVRLIFSNWPSLHPVLTDIEIQSPEVQLYRANDRYAPPFKTPTDSTDSNSALDAYIDIRNITVRDFSLATINQAGNKKSWDDIQISAKKQGAVYNIFLNKLTYDAAENLMISGTIDPNNYETRLSIDLACQAQREQVAELVTALDIPIVRQAEGKIMASLNVSGHLDEPEKLQFNGIINLNDCNISAFRNLDVTNLNTVIKAAGRRLDFQRITAQTVNGTISGSLYTDIPIDRPVQVGGKFYLEKIDLDKLTDAITELPKITRGTATAQYAFSVQSTGFASLNGYGMLFFDDAHLWNLPVVLQLFDQFKIKGRDPLSTSDLITLFAMKGPNTIFQQAMLANALSAIEMEPGGRINLQTAQIDMYVIGVPLKTLRKIVSAIPLVKLLIPLRDRFSRLHLRGTWNDPPSALVFKEPFKKMEQDTQKVFTDVAKTEGQFNEDTVKLFKGMFEELSRKKSTPAK